MWFILPGEVDECGWPGHGRECWGRAGGPTCLAWLMVANRGKARSKRSTPMCLAWLLNVAIRGKARSFGTFGKESWWPVLLPGKIDWGKARSSRDKARSSRGKARSYRSNVRRWRCHGADVTCSMKMQNLKPEC